ncbi:Thiol-disulfide isomerase or thioredoxin [Modicisalibacter muralis]|uniref:Thiol-disulfide isomerase or thioredoxin n=1 Tax=Modicisalibacter muralis TaxID=119000 RepID=A0A1G9QMI1_9GAMM|nr:TlpA disulfide reductase family protein [Halomonas muralis]SDM12229.1 Thiol-disulfide isomerase or thioredoxin [Halomonas muralis]
MDAIALGPMLISLPRLYAFAAALALLATGMLALRLPAARRVRWFNGVLLTWLIGARLGHVLMHLDGYLVAPLDIIKLWQPGYSAIWGLLAAGAWTAWTLRKHLVKLVVGQGLLVGSFALWLGLVAWNPLGSAVALRELPDLTLENIDGQSVNLGELRGETVVLNLWATWCPPCLREMPLLAEADERDDVTVVVANQGESLLAVTRYLDAQGLDFSHALLDPEQRLMVMTESPGLPTSLLFDAQGQLVERHIGELSRTQLESWLSDR